MTSHANPNNLPRYSSHKEVSAVKIKEVRMESPVPTADKLQKLTNEKTPANLFTATIYPEDPNVAPFAVTQAYLSKHQPTAGGYFVVYEDGYQSFSPASAFEKGYTLIGG